MTASISLPDRTRLRFGGCLVCLLVIYRQSLGGTFDEKSTVQKEIAATIEELICSGLGSRCRELCDQADALLERMHNLLDQMTPQRARDVLLPIFSNQNVSWNDGGQISVFLNFLCNTSSRLWAAAEDTHHDLRHDFSDLGGLVRSVRQISESRDLSSHSEFEDIARLLRHDCEHLTRSLVAKDRASGAILAAYQGSEYHRAAVTILLERLHHVSLSDTQEAQRLGIFLQCQAFQPTGSPRLSYMLTLLRMASPSLDLTTDILADAAVSELLSLSSDDQSAT
jgi:hypothetical protein